jgi:hydroxymethylpyrimidine/phosphomethylpyrimidine kinase
MTAPAPHRRALRVLSIAGSDSGGGAGIQADLKTFAALGCFGTTAITAVTAQNTVGVSAIQALPAAFLAQQIDAVLSDIGTDAIKIGMLHDAEVVAVVASALRLLCGQTITTPEQALDCAAELLRMGARAVLVKGGHLPGNTVVDTLVDASGVRLRLVAPRIHSVNLHGTGCTLSSAIAAFLARGLMLEDAITQAHAYVRAALESSRQIHWGKGHGPLNHSHAPVALITRPENSTGQ